MALGKNLEKDALISGKENGKAKGKASVSTVDNNNVDFLQIMESSIISIVMVDAQGLITYFNKAAERLWNYEIQDVIGENVKILTPPDVEFIPEGKNKGMDVSREIKILTKDKKHISVKLSLSESVTNGEKVYTAFVNDNSEQSKILENQEQQQRELNTRMDQINVACIVSESDLKGNIIYVNDKLCEVSQYTREECIGQPHSMFRHPDMPKEVFKEMWSTIGRGQIFRGKIKNRKKDGSHYWVDALIAPVLGANGKPVKYIGVRYDITDVENKTMELQTSAEEMKAAEEELRQNMEELTATQEEMERKQMDMNGTMNAINTTSAFIEFNLDGTIVTANDLFLQTMKYSMEEIKDKHHQIFCEDTYTRSGDYKNFWNDLRAGKPQTGEFKRIAKDGSEVWLLASYTPVVNARGEVAKVIKLANDITASKTQTVDFQGQLDAIHKSQAVIEFDLDGTIRNANSNFLSVLGYKLEEVKGKHHSIFVSADHKNSGEYSAFWKKLNDGQFEEGEFLRIAKGGTEKWIQASYNPIFDLNGKPYKVVKFATDITAKKALEFEVQNQVEEMSAQEEELRQNMEELTATQEEMERKQMDMNGTMNAINTTSAFIEFTTEGNVVSANDLFLQTMQYSLEEIKDKHHRIFCEKEYTNSRNYENFWNDLRAGRAQTGTFKRVAKDGSEVWLMASYTPVFDGKGEVAKVIKLATDITESSIKNADFQGQMEAVSKSYGVIEFNLDGTIRTANENFLNVVGYSLNQIQGKHHSMFVDSEYARSIEYKKFWEKLNDGEFLSGTFNRLNRNGDDCFIQATYNPIMDINGKPFKVVKYATDITEFTRALKAVSHFVGELRDGNFNAEINVRAEGDVGKMIEDNLALKATISEILSDVNEVVKKAGVEGNLNARLDNTGRQGTWKQLVDSVNILLQSIAEPVLEFNSIITEMSKGDLSRKFEMKTNGDLKGMAEALNLAIGNLNNLLGNISENVNIVSDSARNTLSKSESMKSNTDEMASAISQMAKGAQDQAQRTDESSKLVEQVLASSDDMESKSGIIYKAAEKGVASCEQGLKIIKKLVDNMDGINGSASLTNESIKVLTERAVEIGRTLNVITDIASQTNLLALNAAIEAARAGEAGRGFAVVAEEIRKLAEDSRKSAVDIEKIIGDVQKDTQSASKAIETMAVSVKEGTAATKDAESIFQEIAESSGETLSFSGAIKEATVKQKSSIDTVAKNIEQIVVVAEETAAGTEEIATSSQELNNGMQEVAVSSNQLTKIASDLKADISKFKLQ